MSCDALGLWWWTYDMCQRSHATMVWVTCQQSPTPNNHSSKHTLFSCDFLEVWRLCENVRFSQAAYEPSHKITLYSHAVFGESGALAWLPESLGTVWKHTPFLHGLQSFPKSHKNGMCSFGRLQTNTTEKHSQELLQESPCMTQNSLGEATGACKQKKNTTWWYMADPEELWDTRSITLFPKAHTPSGTAQGIFFE